MAMHFGRRRPELDEGDRGPASVRQLGVHHLNGSKAAMSSSRRRS
jgi:hypothetical protein